MYGDIMIDNCKIREYKYSKWLYAVLALAAMTLLYWNLALLAKWITYSLLCLPPEHKFSLAIEFFLFETPKVMLLLVGVVFVVGIIRSFFSPERTKKILAGRSEFAGNVLAAHLGIVTPFCSCSAVPLFIGFVTAGIPLGVTFSFLISAPMINEVALVLLFGLFGWKVAGLYLATGLFIAVFAGWVIGRMRLERYVEPWVYSTEMNTVFEDSTMTWGDRVCFGREAVADIVKKVWPYVVAGIAVGAGIHGYVPQDFMASIMGRSAWWSVPLAVLLGVPMYSNAAGIIPIVQALLEKGAALGTVLAFMMSVIGLSLPEAVILRKVLKLQLVLIFFGVVAAGILLVGILFNLIMPYIGF
jgi:uncharacterized membrane protein YraQ (UPF0718 family)